MVDKDRVEGARKKVSGKARQRPVT